MDDLHNLLRAWSRRARLQQGLSWIFAGLAAGLLMSILPALVARVAPLADSATLLAAGSLCGAAGVLAALAWPWLTRRQNRAAWARQFDRQFRLDERISTAVELDNGTIHIHDDDLRRRQLDDALAAARSIDARRAIPLRLSWRQALAALGAGAVFLLATLSPNPQQQVLANRAEVRQAMAEQSRALDEARQTIAGSELSDEAKQQASQAIEEAQRQLDDPNTSAEQALAALNDAQARIDALRDQAWQQQREEMQRAGQALQPDELTNRLADSLSAGDFDQAAQDLRNLTEGGNGQPLDESQRQRLANQLDQLARGMQRSDPSSAQRLRDAAQQLREGDVDAARQQLNQVAGGMDNSRQAESAARSIDKTQSQVDASRRAIAQAAGQEQNGQPAPSAQASAAAGNDQPDQAGQTGSPSGGQQSSAAGSAQSGTGSESRWAQAGNADAGAERGGQATAGHHEDTGTDDSVYADPSRLNGGSAPVVLPNDKDRSTANPSGNANPGIAGQTLVPYRQVYSAYAQAADEAIQSGSIPPDLRNYVRDYFSSLDPQ